MNEAVPQGERLKALPGCVDLIGWRSIDTAPRDGTRILTFNVTPTEDEDTGRTVNEEAVSIAYWCLGGWMEYPARPRWIQGQRHLYWMPLPPLPQLRPRGELAYGGAT